jgi:hypothetical protein
MVYPMFMMVFITLGILCLALAARVQSVITGQVKARSYKLMDAEVYPDNVIKTTRNFNNQFEIPVLFYIVCLLFLVLDIDSSLGLVLAWSFVFARFFHAVVHITYNKLYHRMFAFWMGNILVAALWVTLVTKVIQQDLF